jgi:hypothetical protein
MAEVPLLAITGQYPFSVMFLTFAISMAVGDFRVEISIPALQNTKHDF